MNIHTARCLRHPSESVVGVCGSCLKDRLAFIKEHSLGPPSPSVQLSSSHFERGNGRARRSKLLDGSNICVESIEKEPKQQWRSRSLCERRYVRVSLGAVTSSYGTTSDGQFSRNLSGNKVTLRALFELDDSEQQKIASADALTTDCCERAAAEETAKGCQDVGYTFKEPSCKIQEDAASRTLETIKPDEGSPGKSICGAVCPASHGGKHSFWWVTLKWRRKARRPKAQRSEGLARPVEEETTSAACKKQAEERAGAEAMGRTFWGWRRSKDTESPVAARAEGVEAAESSSTEAEEGAKHREPALAMPGAGGEEGGGEEESTILPIQERPDCYRRPDYRSASCNATSTWLGTDYRTWEAYYSPAAERMKPAAAAVVLQRNVSRRDDRSYLDRMRTVKISPALSDHGSLLRFYLTPLGTSSRRRGSGRPPPRTSARGALSFLFSR